MIVLLEVVRVFVNSVRAKRVLVEAVRVLV
jgi:hypothetical protein